MLVVENGRPPSVLSVQIGIYHPRHSRHLCFLGFWAWMPAPAKDSKGKLYNYGQND